MPWKRMLAYITGSVNEDLLRRIEYLLGENRVLRNQIDSRILLTDNERCTLATKAVALGKLMADTITIVKPETILKWHRRLVAKKFDGSRFRKRRADRPPKPKLKNSSSVWPETIPRGATTELLARYTIWGTTSATRRWATSFSETPLGHHPSDGAIRHGAISFAGTGKCCGRQISSRRRFGRAGD